jgi:hypothetical protein
MKRLALGVVIAAVLAAAITYWHVVDQLEDRLGTLAGLVAPIGQLSWSGIRIDPRGRASVTDLRFQPHDHRDRIRVERVTVDAGGLFALLRLDRVLDSGRMPAALSVAAEGMNLPVNQQLDAWIGAPLPPLPWIAAGCPPIEPLHYYALGELGWWELTVDAQFGYRHLERQERVELAGRVHVHRLGETRLSAKLVVPDREEPLGRDVTLERARVTVTNRGFFDRLFEVCADRTGLTVDQFRTVHLEAWEDHWQARGLQPGPVVLAGYRHFLGQPESLSIALDPETVLDLADPTRLAGPAWQRLGARFSVNSGTEVDFRFDSIAPDPAPAAAPTQPDQPEGPGIEKRSSESAEPSSPSPIPGRTFGPVPQWQSISLDRAAEYVGARIRLELVDGTHYSGQLVGVDGDNLHLSIRNRLGQIVRPLPRAEIARAEIRP